MLDYRVETFLTVCQEMNYTKAAERLNITQPNVSQHIRWLEERYQQKLFVYQGRKLLLTPAGETLKKAVISMRHEEELFRQQMSSPQSGVLRISFGVTKSIYEGSMKTQIIGLLKKHVGDHVKFMVDNTRELLEELQNGMLDFAIVEGNFDKELFDHQILKEDAFLPVCAPGYLPEKAYYSVDDLFSGVFIVREPGSGSREISAHILESQNYSFQNFAAVMEVGEIGAIKELLKAGMGISFLYETAVEEELAAGELVRIPMEHFMISHAFCMVWLKTDYFYEYYQRFAEELVLK